MNLPDYKYVFNVYQHCREALESSLPAGEAGFLQQKLLAKSEQLKPVIMVYGVYNAGKSTLLNALMGRSEAQMADRPMTDSVTGYSWKGYTLYDTPGIDAPQQHQQVTEQQLRSADAVLFVVASGGAIEEKSTWQGLISLVQQGRRVMLIVNNKSGLKSDSMEYSHILDQLRERLQIAANEVQVTDILSKVTINLVNARSALKGRLENKHSLINSSGIIFLEEQLSHFLKQTDHYSILCACYSDLKQAINTSLTLLAKNNSNVKVETLLDMKLRVDAERERLTLRLNDKLDNNISMHKTSLANNIDGEMLNCSSQQELEAAINSAIEDISIKIHQQQSNVLTVELPKTQRKLDDIGEKLLSADLRAATLDHTTVNHIEKDDVNTPWREGMEQILGHSSKIDVKAIAETGTLKGLEIGKELLPKLFKGIGPKTMERWSSTVGRYAGPAVAVGIGAWNIYNAVAENEKKKIARCNQRQAAEDSAASLMTGLQNAWQEVIRDVVDEIFGPLEDFIKSQREEHKNQSGLVANYIAQLESANNALRGM